MRAWPACSRSTWPEHGRSSRPRPDARLVFLAPPSWDELVRRLTGRGTEPAEVRERRLAAAREELAAADEFEITLVNTSVQDVCRELVALMEQ